MKRRTRSKKQKQQATSKPQQASNKKRNKQDEEARKQKKGAFDHLLLWNFLPGESEALDGGKIQTADNRVRRVEVVHQQTALRKEFTNLLFSSLVFVLPFSFISFSFLWVSCLSFSVCCCSSFRFISVYASPCLLLLLLLLFLFFSLRYLGNLDKSNDDVCALRGSWLSQNQSRQPHSPLDNQNEKVAKKK